MGKKFMLNKNYGINGIDKVSLKNIIKVFSFPNEIEIYIEKSKIDISIDLIYENLIIYYTLNFFVENLKKPEFHYLIFKIEKLYLSKNENIKIGDEIKHVLSKIKKYLKKNKKKLSFEYEEDRYYGKYVFDDGNITVFFEKEKDKKIVDGIMVSIPYEDIKEKNKETMKEIKEIIELKNKIDKLLFNL